jgi:hypothetical protein
LGFVGSGEIDKGIAHRAVTLGIHGEGDAFTVIE